MRLAARIAGIGLVGPGLAGWHAAREALAGRVPYAGAPTRLAAPEALPATERRRAGRCVKLALAAGLDAVAGAGADAGALGAIFASSSGDGETCHAICETLASDDRLISPTRFHNSVHNAPAGYWSIATGATASIDCLGAFDASFVPSADDFDRLDPRFRLPSGVRDALPQYADYGFAVFKLRDTAGAVKGAHPMAFEFETRMPQALFLPTVHVHDGSLHAAARFDHIAYLQGPCVLGEARYFSEAGELDEVAVASKREDLWRRRVDGWKFDREAGGLGVIWPAGPSESLRDSRDDQELAKVLRLVDEGKLAVETLPKSWRWIRMPLLDPRQDLYALGMSGMLPNADTFIPLAR